MRILAVIASLTLTLLAFIVGLAKVQRLPASLQVRDQAKVSAVVWAASGWVELAAAACLVIGIFVSFELALVSAVVLLVCYLALAARQLSQRVSIAAAVPAIALSALAAIVAASILGAG